jgi:hypothetical protein
MPGICRKEVVATEPHSLQRHLAVWRQLDLVLCQGQRLCQKVADTGFVVHHQDPRWSPGPAPCRSPCGRGSRGWHALRAFAFEPRVDVSFSETPLPSDPDRGDLSCLD